MNDFDLTPRQPPGVSALASNRLDTHSAFEFYSLFLDNDILHMLVNETNRYAEQCTVDAISKERRSYVVEKLQDVTRDDLLTFLGLVLWMGLDKKPKLRNYWSKNSIYYSKLSKSMSRNRFEEILSCMYIFLIMKLHNQTTI